MDASGDSFVACAVPFLNLSCTRGSIPSLSISALAISATELRSDAGVDGWNWEEDDDDDDGSSCWL